MNTLANTPAQDTYGCCEANVPQPEIYNRPGLPKLDYRIGTHPVFLRRGLARLPSQRVPSDGRDDARPLAHLTTRSSDDPAIALLDAWATVADVLTFYQERLANEGFLLTATERRSVLELARAIGYELRSGVAASTFLAFTVEDAPGSPEVATVPQGTKVQSIPDQGKLPQTFETSAEITAHARWNALRPRLTRPQELALAQDGKTKQNKLYLLGLSTRFGPNATPQTQIPTRDAYPLDPTTLATLPDSGPVQAVETNQMYLVGTNTNLKAGDLLLLVGKSSANEVRTLVQVIKHVEVEVELDRTRVAFTQETSAQEPSTEEVAAEPLPSFAPLFLERATVTLDDLHLDQETVDAMIRYRSWRERDLAAFLSIQGWSRRNLVEHINDAPPTKQVPSTPAGSAADADEGAFAFREQVGFFGHNAPLRDSLPVPDERTDPYAIDWDEAENNTGRNIWTDSQGNPYSVENDYYAHLERDVPGILDNSWAVFRSASITPIAYWVSAISEVSRADYGLNARTTRLKLLRADGGPLIDASATPPSNALPDFKVRSTTAHVRSDRMGFSDLPIEDPVESGSTSLQLDQMVLGLQVGQPLVLGGERHDLPGVNGDEIVILSDILHSGGYTTLFFTEGLQHSYVRKTIALNANVARATHGETTVEVLGSGDGARPNQRFTLKRPPLTQVSAPTASGSQSTLRVRVNDVLWEEVPQLYGLDERSKCYIVQTDDNGETRVIFGDGTKGASLPTGTENVVATYRSGIGLSGMAASDKLTLLQTRPLGIRGVTNPVPASGADEPESRDSASTNAPLTVLTLDRIVSLRDYENFVSTFAGIGKAQAVMLWKGETRLVHITIAAVAPTVASGVDGARSALATNVVDRTSPLYTNLIEAIQEASDPAQRFRIDSYQPLFFNVKAKVMVDSAYMPAAVLDAVEGALKETFSFERRDFGQPVTPAEIITTIQGVPGVVATDLDHLYRYRDDQPPPDPDEQIPPEVLEARQVRLKGTGIEPTQLLLVNPVGIKLEEMAR